MIASRPMAKDEKKKSPGPKLIHGIEVLKTDVPIKELQEKYSKSFLAAKQKLVRANLPCVGFEVDSKRNLITARAGKIYGGEREPVKMPLDPKKPIVTEKPQPKPDPKE